MTAGCEIDCSRVWADNPAQARLVLQRQLAKLGASEFWAARVDLDLPRMPHLPLATLNGLRRALVEELRRQRARLRPCAQSRTRPTTSHFPSENCRFSATCSIRRPRLSTGATAWGELSPRPRAAFTCTAAG